MNDKITRIKPFVLPVLLTLVLVSLSIFLTVINFHKVSFQKEIATLKENISANDYWLVGKIISQNLETVINQAINQEELAKGGFDTLQYSGGGWPSDVFLPPRFEESSELKKVLDLMEEKWTSLHADNYYDEVGIFLMYGNAITGRFSKSLAIYERMAEKLPGKSIDPYFYNYSVMDKIDRTICRKEFFSPREDLSLLYAAKIVIRIYNNDEKAAGEVDKAIEILQILIKNYEGTEGAKFLATALEMAKDKRNSLKSAH